MAEQIRVTLTLDDAVKALAEEDARELCDGNVSAYVRGLVVFHRLLMKKDTGRADIPGWMLAMYPLRLIDRMTETIEKYYASFAQKEFYQRVAPSRDASQVRINDLARELEVKASTIVDLLPSLGVTEKKTYSSSIPVAIAEKVREELDNKNKRASPGLRPDEPK
jgi:Translation initiation factor IF-2, N-terminal region